VNVSDVDRMTEAEGENELKSNAGNELWDLSRDSLRESSVVLFHDVENALYTT
jgi:hypothetical protein